MLRDVPLGHRGWLRPRGSPLVRRVPAKPGQDALEHGKQPADAARLDREVPERLELLPTAGIRDVAEPSPGRLLGPGAAEDRAPTIEVPIGPPVAGFEGVGGHALSAEDDVTSVVAVPVTV